MFVPTAILCVVALVVLARGDRRDRLALGSGLLFVMMTLVITVFYTWEYRGLRAILFTVPFLAVSVAPLVSSGVSRVRSKLPAVAVIVCLLFFGYWGSGRLAKRLTATDGARAVEVMESLNLDKGSVVIAPVSLALDFVLRNYPLRWVVHTCQRENTRAR